VPTFNGARFLADTLESLRSQTSRLLVVDDASTDDTVAVARRCGVAVVEHRERAGLTGNWNRALRLVDSEHFVLAHQDDVYEPSFVATMEALIESRPRAFAAHCRVRYIDERGRLASPAAARYKETFWPQQEPYEREPLAELRALQRGNYIIAPSAIYRSAAVRELGEFDESYQFVPDWDYWVRGLIAGRTIVGTHARLVGWRRHAGTATWERQRSLARYDDEIAIQESLAARARLPVRYGYVEKVLLSDFAARLANGDRVAASALSRYARQRAGKLGRRSSALMAAMLACGRLGGVALRSLEWMAVRLAAVAVRADPR